MFRKMDCQSRPIILSKKVFHHIICFAVAFISLISCERQSSTYYIVMEKTVNIEMHDFMVFGPFDNR